MPTPRHSDATWRRAPFQLGAPQRPAHAWSTCCPIVAGGVPPLVKFLERDQELQANAAGAIQSICFQKEGRQYLRELGAVPAILPLLSSPSLKARADHPASQPVCHATRVGAASQVRTRAVGAVHNISSEAEAIRIIRRLHAIGTAEISPRSRRGQTGACAGSHRALTQISSRRDCISAGAGPLVELLRVPNATVCGSAAGALQNLSRESHARDEIHELGAITPLTDLLFGEDVQAQVTEAEPPRDAAPRNPAEGSRASHHSIVAPRCARRVRYST